MTEPSDVPLRYPSRYDSPDTPAERRCSVCQVGHLSARARYCSTACKQHAYRLRQAAPPTADLAALTADLRRRQALVDHTLYECPSCETRYLAERRCPDCHRFCRRLGLGGPCPGCDDLILIAEILDREVTH